MMIQNLASQMLRMASVFGNEKTQLFETSNLLFQRYLAITLFTKVCARQLIMTPTPQDCERHADGQQQPPGPRCSGCVGPAGSGQGSLAGYHW